ncbi:Non-specific serine/threonine protein kinase protein [Dioscorea alata]|uniref:Non-specific serine/threonine protein kinase protein n=1 Tax=Dioscorea alata TaxID=55571 RepID=A0ACB7VGA7_DIOAL|nr:Non-specific serine/threonine protein kinase protein [Dioscorea alata]
MAQSMVSSSMRDARIVGDYILSRRIGSGSFSVVWYARHRVRGTEVAVKEIVMERLGKKLQDSLLSEIDILKRIDHPNVISLHDIIKASGRIYLVLEYCRGGDLSMYIHRRGRVPEDVARHFMQQLASGLMVLRENNLIHRDLKPQNLLLSTNDENSILKIADFGFARSLQPRGLAETLCGSPLYMAPEIMQLQKYDAKADLWSVGAILFQLVTGKTPFTGNNQIELLKNIIKSNELWFPPTINLSCDCIDLCQKLLRRNPVERLTFEEFFVHPFLSKGQPDELLSQASPITRDNCTLVESSPARHSEGSSQEDCLPFILDDDSSGHDVSPSVVMKNASRRSTYGFSVDNKLDESPVCSPSRNTDNPSRYSNAIHISETTSSRNDSYRYLDGSVKGDQILSNQKLNQIPPEDPSIVDSLEFVDQEYVLVSGPPLELPSSSTSASRPCNLPGKLGSSPGAFKTRTLSAPMPIIGAVTSNSRPIGSLGSHSSPASGTSQGSMDVCDAMEQPSTDCMTRIQSLQKCASVITDLVNQKIEDGSRLENQKRAYSCRLEAFSVQLVLLAIWKQALHICHAQAASAMEGSPSQEVGQRASYNKNASNSQDIGSIYQPWLDSVCQQIEKEFLLEVDRAENLAQDLGQVDETTEMPDAIEIIFRSALDLGKHGAVNEMMEHVERAEAQYSQAVQLLYFLLVEAPSLILNPPFSLTNSDRYRIRTYIDILNNRQDQSRSQRVALLKCEDQ